MGRDPGSVDAGGEYGIIVAAQMRIDTGLPDELAVGCRGRGSSDRGEPSSVGSSDNRTISVFVSGEMDQLFFKGLVEGGGMWHNYGI